MEEQREMEQVSRAGARITTVVEGPHGQELCPQQWGVPSGGTSPFAGEAERT